MFGFLKKKKSVTALDQLIFAMYGNPPPPKRADVEKAAVLASEELLGGAVEQRQVRALAKDLNEGPIPYTTHELALSVAMNFFKRPDYMSRLNTTQMFARVKMLAWLEDNLVHPMLVQSFEQVLYKLYKP